MKIETYKEQYCREITDLFCDAVHAIDLSLYSDQQKAAWAPKPPDYEFWKQRLEVKKPFMAMVEGRVAGFVELEGDGHIDCLYVHPDFQGHGFGSKMVGHVIRVAREGDLQQLYVEASKAARPLFEKMGFSLVRENLIERKGVQLVNYRMLLKLS